MSDIAITNNQLDQRINDCKLTERIIVIYNDNEKRKMNLDKRELEIQLEKEELKCQNDDIAKWYIFPNQNVCGYRIMNRFKCKKTTTVMCIGLTQCGKTVTMVSLTKHFITNFRIPVENIFIITGLSDKEWKNQTKEKIPDIMRKRVFHRNQIKNKFLPEIEGKKNILIIMDEIQIAAKENQTLYNLFKTEGLWDNQVRFERDIKIVQFSATPDCVLDDLKMWGDSHAVEKLQPGETYTSCFDLPRQNRVFQYKDLCGYNKNTNTVSSSTYENIKEVQNKLATFKEPMYHIIRTPNGYKSGIVIENFHKVFGSICYEQYDKDSDCENINEILSEKPSEHTFIFIKEKIRCAKTLNKKYLGVLYERYIKSIPNDAVIIQGLLGRITGYDDNGLSICFTNVDTIGRYEKLYESDFKATDVIWHSSTRAGHTFNLPASEEGLRDNRRQDKGEPTIKSFSTYEEAKKFYNKELKPRFGGTGPRKRKPNSDGFYETTVGKLRGKDIYSCEEIYNIRKWALNDKHKHTFHPCYEDVNDKDSLEFWLIYYKTW